MRKTGEEWYVNMKSEIYVDCKLLLLWRNQGSVSPICISFYPQPGGPLLCTSRMRTIGPLSYRTAGKEKQLRALPASGVLFRLVSFGIYFLFGIFSLFSSNSFILLCPSLFSPKLLVRDLKLSTVWEEPSEMGRSWKTGMGSTGGKKTKQGKLCSRKSFFLV